MKLYLVDGTFEVFRYYYGAPEAYNHAKEPVGAIRGLLRGLQTLVKRDDLTHIAVAFDHVIESFRNQLFSGYKTGDNIDKDLWFQLHKAYDICKALGIVYWPMEEFEADDAIATAATRWVNAPDMKQVVICSPDKDLYQVVCAKKIISWDRIRQKFIDESGVQEKFGVGPESIADLLALTGDTADGVPGIPRWGLKSSSIVLDRYKHIENIPRDFKSWDFKVRGAEGLGREFDANYDNAILYKKLTTLRLDVPIKEELEDLRWKGADQTLLKQVSEELEL